MSKIARPRVNAIVMSSDKVQPNQRINDNDERYPEALTSEELAELDLATDEALGRIEPVTKSEE